MPGNLNDASAIRTCESVRCAASQSVPTSGMGRVRLMEIAGVDLQPCGGTHVCNTAEIGPVVVTKIENKGKQNRRVILAFAE